MTQFLVVKRGAFQMKSNPTIQDVLRRFYPEYLKVYCPNEQQTKAARHILNGKTGAYGFNISSCSECGYIHIHNNSCRDRCCPMCQAISNELWIDDQTEHVLDIDYYHLVFTCPEELNVLIYHNQKEMYSLFFRAVTDTITDLSMNPSYLGGMPGFISVMHTWSSNLLFHPHIHVLCTGGGLDTDKNWHQKKNGYFLPGRALAKLFKSKFLDGLKSLHDSGKLHYSGKAEKYRNIYEYKELLNLCYKKNWVTDIRESFAGAETVMNYLGRYTHRIAISNNRILSMDEKTVTFRVKEYKNEGKWKNQTLAGVEFIRRFLMHVPPKRFVRIRHYGLLSNQKKRKLIPLCRNLIGCRQFLRRLKKNDKVQAVRLLYGKDITICPCCGKSMEYRMLSGRIYRIRSA